VEIAPHGQLIVNDPELMVDAALQGVGLAYLVESMVSGHLASGRLVRVLEDWSPSFPGFYLYYPSPGRKQLSPALRALIAMLRVVGE
jgi:DNA-binding transcriptional LysR family regulator